MNENKDVQSSMPFDYSKRKKINTKKNIKSK